MVSLKWNLNTCITSMVEPKKSHGGHKGKNIYAWNTVLSGSNHTVDNSCRLVTEIMASWKVQFLLGSFVASWYIIKLLSDFSIRK